MLPPNWMTSLFGTGSIASAVVTVGFDIFNKQMPSSADMSLLMGLFSAGIGLIQAKDKNVTGGTISNVTGLTGAPVSLIDKGATKP
jgi:hypothetical protein